MVDAQPNPLNELTTRQKELLDLVVSGTTQSKALAQKTGLAPGSVDVFLMQAARILGVRGRKMAAERYRELREKSEQQSEFRKSPLEIDGDRALTPPAEAGGRVPPAGTGRRFLKTIGDFFRGPPLGGEENSLRWDRITLEVFRVALIGMISLTALALFVLGFYHTFG